MSGSLLVVNLLLWGLLVGVVLVWLLLGVALVLVVLTLWLTVWVLLTVCLSTLNVVNWLGLNNNAAVEVLVHATGSFELVESWSHNNEEHEHVQGAVGPLSAVPGPASVDISGVIGVVNVDDKHELTESVPQHTESPETEQVFHVAATNCELLDILVCVAQSPKSNE